MLTCPAFLATNTVRGTFEGDPTRSSQVAWLRAAHGGQVTVAWPEGFTVRFEPGAVLYNERGLAVARHGQEVELSQVNVEEHAGTLQDPYFASGIVFDQCYAIAR